MRTGWNTIRLTLVLLCLSPIVTSLQEDMEDPSPHVEVTLVAEQNGVQEGGLIWLGVHLDIEDPWHLYWKGKSDTGMPISLSLQSPEGTELGEVLWPAPTRYTASKNFLDHVYSKEVTLLFPMAVDPSLPPGTALEVAVRHEWLVCQKETCLLGSGTASLSVPILKKEETPGWSERVEWFRATRARLPQTMPSDSERREDGQAILRRYWQNGDLVLHAPEASQMVFYPHERSTPVHDLKKNGFARGDRMTLSPVHSPSVSAKLTGIIEIHWPDNPPLFYFLEEIKP